MVFAIFNNEIRRRLCLKLCFTSISRMVNPKLRKRLVDSIEYLRKMGFFQNYSDLSSEEILKKI